MIYKLLFEIRWTINYFSKKCFSQTAAARVERNSVVLFPVVKCWTKKKCFSLILNCFPSVNCFEEIAILWHDVMRNTKEVFCLFYTLDHSVKNIEWNILKFWFIKIKLIIRNERTFKTWPIKINQLFKQCPKLLTKLN